MPAPSSNTSASPARQPWRVRWWLGALLNLGLWLALWALLSSNQGWAFGLPLALLATLASLRLRLHTGPIHLRYLPGFLGFFILELFIGGWDVARRAWHPRLPIKPQWVRYEVSSADPRVQLLLSAMVGLLPGTLASHVDGQTLHLHALDHRQNWSDTVAHLEQHLDQLLEGPSR